MASPVKSGKEDPNVNVEMCDSDRKLLDTERNNESGVVNPNQVEVQLLGQLKEEDKDV